MAIQRGSGARLKTASRTTRLALWGESVLQGDEDRVEDAAARFVVRGAQVEGVVR